MRESASVLVVDHDRDYGRALALLLKRRGHRVRVVRTRGQALVASAREHFDLAIVDLLLGGGGSDLARLLSGRVGELFLSLAPPLARRDVLEFALGFPVVRKATLPASLGRHPAARVRHRSRRFIHR
jgi:hypothetical protein